MKRLFPLAALFSFALDAHAATEGPGIDQYLRAIRAEGRIQVDGKLDEPSWAAAPVFDGMLQRFPDAGAPPTERTEVRVLYDDQALYVGITAYDSEPSLINRRLARRDSDLVSDAVHVLIDPTHDHRTAYVFDLNAGGVQGDGIIFDDRVFSRDWDGIWDGAAGTFAGGWVAEYAIPLGLLRFPNGSTQTWGFCIRRDIARKNEELDSAGNPRSSNAGPSRFGHLVGMEGLRPRQAFELIPYVATRSTLRPQPIGLPDPRLLGLSADLGLDLKTSLTSDLTLNATLNPDFGQVEADRLLLNLTTFESYFPEKRPFFTQGMEIFQPVGSDGVAMTQTLFYSRRIGFSSPILGAAKLTGTVSKGVEIGLLDAFVMGARPLHLGLNDEPSGQVTAPTNYMTAVVRAQVGTSSNVGAVVSTATPLAGVCTDADAASAAPPARCLTTGVNAAAGTFDFRTQDGQWGVLGQLTGSQVVGGPPQQILKDGTVLRRGELGGGGFFRAGKIGGEGLRFSVADHFMSPTLELNPTGFERTQNQNYVEGILTYARPDGFGPLKAFSAILALGVNTSTDGRFISRGTWIEAIPSVTLPSFDVVGADFGLDNLFEQDIREIPYTGIPFERLPSAYFTLTGNSNGNRPVMLYGGFGVRRKLEPTDGRFAWVGDVGLRWRPNDSVETELEVAFERTLHGPRFVDDQLDPTIPYQYVFGDLESRWSSATFRQQWIISPRLSLQAYAQLFTDWGAYGRYYFGSSDAQRTPILVADLSPGIYPDASFYDVALNVNVVARWEYSLGSTLYLVYTRSQGIHLPSAEEPDVEAPHTLWPVGLTQAPARDTFLIKWSYYFAG